MQTYVFYNQKTGKILHIHHEYHPLEEEGDEKLITSESLINELEELLPNDIPFDILVTPEQPTPVNGYKYYVDLATRKLMLVETPKTRKEEK